LRGDLDHAGFVIVRTILAQLSGATPAFTPAAPTPTSQPQQNQQGITLEQLFGLVAQACRPDAPAGLAAQLHATTQQFAADAGMPAEVRALGRALNAVLSDDRAPDLSALPAGLADAVRGMIAGI
jgi:hypothetical protein